MTKNHPQIFCERLNTSIDARLGKKSLHLTFYNLGNFGKHFIKRLSFPQYLQSCQRLQDQTTTSVPFGPYVLDLMIVFSNLCRYYN